MEKKEESIYLGLSLNTIKIIGIITMLIDHIAVYFEYMLDSEIYYILRAIGRVAMPLFVFALVQGYMHTSNLKKYVIRLSLLGIITQIFIYVIAVINNRYFSNYLCYVNEIINIVISLTLTLILLKALDFKNKYIANVNKYINLVFRIVTILGIVIIYYFTNIDYKFTVPILSINFLIFERLKIKNKGYSIYLSSIEYILMLIICVVYNSLETFVIFDIIILFLYNGKKKNKFEVNRIFEYSFFPLHHVVLYTIAMIIGG